MHNTIAKPAANIGTTAVVRPALVLFVVLSLITGLLYPLTMTGLAQTLFPVQANGSLIRQGNTVVGSQLIGQAFSAPGNFWSRPSATSPGSYNAAGSSGANLGPMNPMLAEAVKMRIEALQAADPGNTRAVPIDLVTTSASGLDPHISKAAADYQVARVAKARGMTAAAVQSLVDAHTEGQWLHWLGEMRVNVLELNLALAQAAPKS